MSSISLIIGKKVIDTWVIEFDYSKPLGYRETQVTRIKEQMYWHYWEYIKMCIDDYHFELICESRLNTMSDGEIYGDSLQLKAV